MTAVNLSTGTQSSTPGIRQFELTNTRDGSSWRVFLESEILTLVDSEKRAIMKLHREEAARYIRVSFRSRRIRTLSFVFIEGVRRFTFTCAPAAVAQLLAWLPQGIARQVSKEIRLTGVCMMLCGILQWVLPTVFWGMCGSVLFAAGALAILLPGRLTYAVNGVVLLATGFFNVAWIPVGLSSGLIAPENQLIPLGLGTVLAVWGVFQLLKLGPTQRLRSARAMRDELAAFLPTHSELVRRVGRWNLAVAVFLLLYAAVMWLTVSHIQRPDTLYAELEFLWPDLAVFAVLIALTAASGVFFLSRDTASYIEAKMSAQMLIAIVFFFFGAQTLNFHPDDPLSAFGAVFSENADAFKSPYIWVALMIAVSLFNRWFTRIVDRELEERRL